MSQNHNHFMDEPPKDWDTRQHKLRASFLQSSSWGDFQKNIGHRPHYLSGDGWSCMLVERKTPFGRYLFAPYGPTLKDKSALSPAFSLLKNYAEQEGFDWLIFEPMISGGSHGLQEQLIRMGAKASSHLREPDMTRVIDLSPAKEELLANISQSTRSYIRKNQREGLLTLRESSKPSKIGIFIKMLAAVTDRKNVHFFPDEYFHAQAKLLMPSGMLRQEIALKDGKPVASALFHDYGETSSYTFAASLPEARAFNASALLLWQAMLNAKDRGMKRMDLFGVAPGEAPPSHPWYGFSSFKKKFGGEVIAFAGTWDIPVTPKYRLYRSAQRLRRIIR